MVNAYEPHEHVYETLRRQPSTVLIRGGGIVASRVLQRLIDDRDAHGTNVKIIHLFRTYVSAVARADHLPPPPWRARLGVPGLQLSEVGVGRPAQVEDATARGRRTGGDVQGHRRNEYTDPEELAGAAATRPARGLLPRRHRRGRIGGAEDARRDAHQLRPQRRRHRREPRPTTSSTAPAWRPTSPSTGSSPTCSEHGGAGRNPVGRLDVERHFEVRGTASGDGALYASGAATLGGYFPGVDTFLGLQIAAQEIADDLAGAGILPRISPMRSTTEWSLGANRKI